MSIISDETDTIDIELRAEPAEPCVAALAGTPNATDPNAVVAAIAAIFKLDRRRDSVRFDNVSIKGIRVSYGLVR
ncbi:hypothetical protein [Hyphococcus sp. DH-69]|uniref:hypothetical protein n=1 Tax=Hyphococcus formosus TaxID=3143534 RepID=UPI00398A753E